MMMMLMMLMMMNVSLRVAKQTTVDARIFTLA